MIRQHDDEVAGGDTVKAIVGQLEERLVVGVVKQLTKSTGLNRENCRKSEQDGRGKKGRLVRNNLESSFAEEVLGQSGMDNTLDDPMKTQSMENVKNDKCPINHTAIDGSRYANAIINLDRVDSTCNVGLNGVDGVMEMDLVLGSSENISTNCGPNLMLGDKSKSNNVDGLKTRRWKRRARNGSRIDSGLEVDTLLGKHLLVDGSTNAEKRLKGDYSGSVSHGKSVVTDDISAGRFQPASRSL
ncbi:hypothetical protein Q3G72_022597 [Acer saccharum]|nr:hypothetical protein Q3G72_022597 [Acer saccharum]